jgi:hypothetical protein
MHDTVSNNYYTRSTCRACGEERLRRFVSLGPTPLANSFLKSPDEFEREISYPLNVYFCDECSLVQVAEVVDPRILFGNYIYVTGTANTIVEHNRSYANTVVDYLALCDKDLVVEVASNNGSLLRFFRDQNVRILGVEPAGNIAAIANAAGIETANRFFNASAGCDIRETYGPARAVICNNVLAHVDDTQDFLSGCKSLLADDGLVIIEGPYLREFVELAEFDTVYHEHLCYFSVTSLMRLCDKVGLSIVRIDRMPVHGGSIRMYAAKSETRPDHAAEVVQMSEDEKNDGLTSFETFERFALAVHQTREKLRFLLQSLKADGKSIAAYGAPAKGNTLLNYCGIDTKFVDFTVDKNPLKVGLYTPGAHLPVLPVSELSERRPDYLLILAWNFADEIMLQQAEFAAGGGKFIIPIPEPRIV